MIKKRLGRMPNWQRIFTKLSFAFCAISGLMVFFYPQLKLLVFIPASRLVLASHGVSATLILISLGMVLPVHVKAGWLTKSNRLSGIAQLFALVILTASGCLLYYGPETIRDLTLLLHYLFGFLLIGFFLSHVFLKRKATQAHQNMSSIS